MTTRTFLPCYFKSAIAIRGNSIVKSILFLFICFILSADAYAYSYRVTSSNRLNVRSAASKNSEILGQLSQDDIVDVLSVQDGWACISYDGRKGYVSESYLEPVADLKGTSTSSKKKSGGFFSWLFNSEGESAWFTGLKWLFFFGLAIVLFKVLIQAIIIMLVWGVILGAIALLIGYILKWLGWIEDNTMWSIAEWGFYIGQGLGLLDSIFHIRTLFEDAIDSGGCSSSSNSSGLKTATFSDDSGTLYRLTQDSPYSECDYTDQFGGKWSRDSSGFHRQ